MKNESFVWTMIATVLLLTIFGCDSPAPTQGKIVGIDDPNGTRPYLWSENGKAEYKFFIRNDSDNWKYGSADFSARAEGEQFSLSFLNISIAPHDTATFRGSVDYSKRIDPNSVCGPVVAIFDSTADRARMNGNYTITSGSTVLPPEKTSDSSTFEKYLTADTSVKTNGKSAEWNAKVSSRYQEAVELDVTVEIVAVETQEKKTIRRIISIGANGTTEFGGEEILKPGFTTVHATVTVVAVHRRASGR